MYYSDDIIESVREANDIVDLIGTYVRLNKRGSNYVGLCPFHNEKTGSFSVSKSKQMYKCFGCGKGGNVITFMMEYENMTFPEAVKELAGKAGIVLPQEEDDNGEARRKASEREKLLDINKEAATYYYKLLRMPEGRIGYEYLKNRALSDETMKNFGLGYAKYSDGLYKYLKEKGFSDELLKQSALFTFSERGAVDKFWNRVMFPIMDVRGKVIAFGGRIMSDVKNAPKYLNSAETQVFSKSRNLYGLHIAKHTHQNYFLLCEGYMDVISLHQAGFDNAVASLGTSLTTDQARIIKKYVNDVIITYDSDEAGKKAALRAIGILKEAGLIAKVLNMKPYKDPDEFIKALGCDEYRKRIEEASSAFFFETETIMATVDTQNPAALTEFDHKLARKLAAIEDEIERTNYINAAARQYNIDPAALTRLVNKIGADEYSNKVALATIQREKEQRERAAHEDEPVVRSQKLLISMLANNRIYFEAVKNRLSAEDITDPLCNRLYQIIFSLYQQDEEAVHAKIINQFYEVTDQEKVAEILDSSLYDQKLEENEIKSAFADLVVRVLEDSVDVRWQKAIEGNDAATVQKLLIKKNDLADLRTIIINQIKPHM